MLLLLLCLFNSNFLEWSKDSTSQKIISKGTIQYTPKGVSLIPTFTLGKPAFIFNLSFGTEKLSFDPELRFAANGQPWSYMFWLRYKLLENSKFSLKTGIHPALNFKETPIMANPALGLGEKAIIARRFLAGELAPLFKINHQVSISPYYLYSHGFDVGSPVHTHFIAFRNFNQHLISHKQVHADFNQQFYFLRTQSQNGWYYSPSLNLRINKWPFYLSAMSNIPLKSKVPGGDKFIWSLGINYAFNKAKG